jgi:hypothetical protein
MQEDDGRGICADITGNDPLTGQAYPINGDVEGLIFHIWSDLSAIQCVIVEFDNGQKNRARQVPDPDWSFMIPKIGRRNLISVLRKPV